MAKSPSRRGPALSALVAVALTGCAHPGQPGAGADDCPAARAALVGVVQALTKASGTLRRSTDPAASAHLATDLDQVAATLTSQPFRDPELQRHFGEVVATFARLTRGLRLMAAALAGGNEESMRDVGNELVAVLLEFKAPIAAIRARCPD